jgi:hypothetical protein
MSIQHSLPGSGTLWGKIAVGLWALLLALGVWGLVTTSRHLRLRVVLTLTILGQLTLHILYGEETFLYSCHFGPLLVVLAAFSTLTSVRRVALALVVALIVCAGFNNSLQFDKAVRFFERRKTPLQRAEGAMIHRPQGVGQEQRETGPGLPTPPPQRQ